MKSLSLEKMEKIEGKFSWTNALGCSAGVGLVVLAATETSTGIGSIAGLIHFASGVEAIYDYCGGVY